MIFYCKNLFLLMVFSNVMAVRWPYDAIPFSNMKKGIFFLHSDARVSHQRMHVISTDKRVITLNGKKLSNHEITIFGRKLVINGFGECDSVHLMVDHGSTKAFLLRSKKKIK